MLHNVRFIPLVLVLLASSAYAVPILDTDFDGAPDATDNCLGFNNPDQRDTDGDGNGNRCDPDLNNDGAVNFIDLGMLKSVFFSDDADADLNGDGAVNFLDLGIMKSMFFGVPGGNAFVAVTAVPEPHVLGLLGLGLLLIGLGKGKASKSNAH